MLSSVPPLRRLTPISGLAALAALAIAGCGGGGTAAPASGAGAGDLATDGTFKLALNADPGSLDPHASQLGVVQQLGLFTYDPLIHEHGSGFVSGLADRWSVDGSTAEFHLRPGVTCSDGAALTARTVADNINKVADPESASPLIGITVPPGTRATADDEGGTVTLKLSQPAPFLLQGVANLPIVCAKGLKDPKRLVRGADGTGPYVLGSVVPGSKYQLRRRAGYAWGPDGASTSVKGLPAAVEVDVINNETTAANLLLRGELGAAVVAGPDSRRVKAAGLSRHAMLSMFGELFFNQAGGRPTQPAAVRRALTQALDLPALRKASTSGLGTAPTRLTGVSPCGQDTVTGNVPATDTAAAKTALTGLAGKRLTFLYLSKLGPGAAAAAELAVRQWKAAGVDVVAKGETDTQMLRQVFQAGDFDIAWVPVDGQNPSQTYPTFAGPIPAKGGQNFASIGNPTYAASAAQALKADASTTCGLWAKADAALVRDADVVPFAFSDYPVWGTAKTELDTNYYGVLPMSVRLRR
ncbi:MAG TPA: ABC transporter substrate-binding protein [Baekduia sp.]|uniref:ABC transporter substrate-binding protein n=1 Tax=Baekduia sp. TaxID=2600305 RepID=UPI002D769D69|nr:ABC transporter substrate-binding protein [Baekduia sp.]HET6509679.1 ABC transporter substrate-binding protein [Baekduia sp.]